MLTKVTPAGMLTATGVVLLVVVPVPSRPSLLVPQQNAIPALLRAHVCVPPVLICEKLPQLTGIGVIDRVSVRVLVLVRVLVAVRVLVDVLAD
jgi:hypothetical protein